MFIKPCDCGTDKAEYDGQTKQFVCVSCKKETPVPPKSVSCYKCKKLYQQYTWFDPSGCPNCGRSFVD